MRRHKHEITLFVLSVVWPIAANHKPKSRRLSVRKAAAKAAVAANEKTDRSVGRYPSDAIRRSAARLLRSGNGVRRRQDVFQTRMVVLTLCPLASLAGIW
ncbi:hypothetical protein DIJ64_12735 [Mycobacterium leprae]|uniref:Uncharacterized protein n=1 Tax=Mycobacterium leprae TaxID=1769 RepID=A0AAD0KTR3_MYCLR|nr:hypothetical protein DIJ64_12735 [Mycobacterium leprae]